jgi:Protein of unknown function (DUF2652)
MRIFRAVLVIVDISGYTRFIKHRAVSLLHAEAIVTELLEAIIDRAEHPLTINKLEGDAALMYAEIGDDEPAAVRSAVAQVAAFFAAFAQRLGAVRETRRNCSCDACANINDLGLKAFVHVGEVALKQVRQFEELAGENVILIHRLLKNQVPAREYVLLSETAYEPLRETLPDATALRDEIDGESVLTYWVPAQAPGLLALAARALPPQGVPKALERPTPTPSFQHLPSYKVGRLHEAWDHLAIIVRGLFARR